MGRVDDQYVTVAELLGQLVWHAHEDEEVRLAPIETITTAHTGAVVVEGTRSIEEQLGR